MISEAQVTIRGCKVSKYDNIIIINERKRNKGPNI